MGKDQLKFEESLDCGWCGVEDVFKISGTDFTQIGVWGFMPQFNTLKKKCPCCGEESEFGMEWEDARSGGYYIIHEVDED